MQVILSVPIPSEVAMFIGHILSSIISTDLAIPNPVTYYDPFIDGDPSPEAFLVGLFLPAVVVAEEPLFLPAATWLVLPLLFVDEDPVVDPLEVEVSFFYNLPFYS